MKNLFKLTFSCLMVVLTNSLSAQIWTNEFRQTWTNESEIDNRCAVAMQGIIVDRTFESSLKTIYLNTEAAFDIIDGEKYETEPIIIKATPKQYDKARLIITQEGTWFKGVFLLTKEDVINNNDNNDFIAACAKDEFKTGSFYLSDIKRYERFILIEAEILGDILMVYDVPDFKELDDNYDWTIVWNK